MFAELSAALDGIAELDPHALTGEELSEAVVTMSRLLSRLDAATTRVTAAFDAERHWASDGARSGPAWLAWKTRLPMSTARRRVRLGRALRHLPATEAAWAEGDLDSAHVALLAQARTSATEEALAGDEAMLVDQARRLRFEGFSRVLSYWSQLADPDGTEDDASAMWARRRCHLSQSFGGLWFGDVILDPIAGTVVSNQLGRIEAELFEADWAEARARCGDRVATVADLRRTPAQRRADALVEMARRAGSAPLDGRRPAPLFTVLVGYETLAGRICELAGGRVVSPGSLLSWLDDAYVERIVFDGPSRVQDVGRHQRLFTGGLRRAIEVRDRACYHPSCAASPERCEVDHVVPWCEGGLTTQENGRLACGFHNRLRQRRP